ncbi:hypothetical protein HDE_12319 [Halotydeus destructor]|nr:hypothetical protein HDE_12319 [Halotydeus destructor]
MWSQSICIVFLVGLSAVHSAPVDGNENKSIEDVSQSPPLNSDEIAKLIQEATGLNVSLEVTTSDRNGEKEATEKEPISNNQPKFTEEKPKEPVVEQYQENFHVEVVTRKNRFNNWTWRDVKMVVAIAIMVFLSAMLVCICCLECALSSIETPKHEQPRCRRPNQRHAGQHSDRNGPIVTYEVRQPVSRQVSEAGSIAGSNVSIHSQRSEVVDVHMTNVEPRTVRALTRLFQFGPLTRYQQLAHNAGRRAANNRQQPTVNY